MGTLGSAIGKGVLHDFLAPGGNSNLWGGFVDLDSLTAAQKAFLATNGIHAQPLSFARTGSVSNRPGIAQLQAANGRIFCANSVLGRVVDGYAERLALAEDGIEVTVLACEGATVRRYSLGARRVILCTGVVQTLDLLFRSGMLRDGDTFSLSEHKYQLDLAKCSETFEPCAETIIRFTASRAFLHLAGVQGLWDRIKFSRFVPPCIEQRFMSEENVGLFEIRDGAIAFQKGAVAPPGFGRSIHYCDLKINGTDVNGVLEAFNPGAMGLGMAFVKQRQPGPISDSIVTDAFEKIHRIG